MKQRLIRLTIAIAILAAGHAYFEKAKPSGYTFAQKATPAVSFNALAYYDLQGTRLSGTASKRVNLIQFKYNDATIPCLVVDTKATPTGYELAGGASISCGWTESAITAINGEAK